MINLFFLIIQSSVVSPHAAIAPGEASNLAYTTPCKEARQGHNVDP